jgi:hypothetical protein
MPVNLASLAVVLAVVLPSSPRAAPSHPFEIASNKPFVQVSIDGSDPQWFILDTGCRGSSIVARECAERLQLERGAELRADIGAGSGTTAGIAPLRRPVRLMALGETLSVAEPMALTLGHVARVEGRRVDGLIGGDFLARHVVEIDYARRQIAVHDPESYRPPSGATEIPLNLDTGWPVVSGTITPRGGTPIRCQLIIDTGVRNTVTLFRPFAEQHGLYGAERSLRDAVTGSGVGGVSRGDVARLEAMELGSLSFAEPVAVFSRDTTGIFAIDEPHGIVGGELLRRHRTTFDYPHGRLILEPYPSTGSFEFDMSGLFLAAEAPAFTRITVVSVSPETPAARAGVQPGDEIVSVDGRRGPKLRLDDARTLLRAPGARQLEIRRSGKLLKMRLEVRRLV